MFSPIEQASEGNLIPTGITLLDYLLNGGLRSGAFQVFSGFPGGGKSTLAANLISAVIKAKQVPLFIDSECSMSKDRLEALGKSKDIWILKPTSLEEVLEAIIIILMTSRKRRKPEEALEKLGLPKEIFESPIVIIWDSIAASPLSLELEALENVFSAKKPEFNRKLVPVGLNAQVMSIALRNLVPLMDQEPRVTLIATNQYRGKLDLDMYSPLPKSFYGERGEMPGGYAVKHWAYQLLELSSLKREEDGQWVDLRVLKNKHGPLRRGKIFFDYERGFEDIASFTRPAFKLIGTPRIPFEGKNYLRSELVELFRQAPEAFETFKNSILQTHSLQDLLDVGI